jgi:hypothetical protein
MAKERPIFRDIKTWLDMMCKTYTLQEVQMFGVLGFDITHSETFAERYMEQLMKERDRISQNGEWRVSFSMLNEHIYEKVMADIKASPEWIRDAAKPENRAQIVKMTPLQQRMVKIYQKACDNQARIINMNKDGKGPKV